MFFPLTYIHIPHTLCLWVCRNSGSDSSSSIFPSPSWSILSSAQHAISRCFSQIQSSENSSHAEMLTNSIWMSPQKTFKAQFSQPFSKSKALTNDEPRPFLSPGRLWWMHKVRSSECKIHPSHVVFSSLKHSTDVAKLINSFERLFEPANRVWLWLKFVGFLSNTTIAIWRRLRKNESWSFCGFKLEVSTKRNSSWTQVCLKSFSASLWWCIQTSAKSSWKRVQRATKTYENSLRLL